MLKRTLFFLSLTGVLFSACQKQDIPVDPENSVKQLVSFGLKDVNSSRLSFETVGDTIKASVPGNIDLSSLAPEFYFEGAGISPANRSVQDFRTVKTYTVTAKDSTKKTFYVKVQCRDVIYIGGGVEIIALDAKDGALIWNGGINENFAYSSPVLKGNVLYCGSISGNMYALNARTGQVIWKKWLAGTGIESPAIINDSVLYVGTNDDDFFALNATTGETIWTFKTSGNVSTKAVIFNDKVIFGSSDGYVYALHTATGSKVWEYQTDGGMVASSPVLSDGKVFIGARNNAIHAIDAATGTEVWTSYTGVSMEQSRLVVSNGTVYAAGWYNVPDFNLRGSLYALNEQTGTLKWHALDSTAFSGPLTLYNGMLYLPGDDSKIHAVDATTGASVWSKEISPNGSGVAVKNGTVYICGGGTGTFYAFNALTGNEIWSVKINSSSTSQPAISRTHKTKAPSILLP